MLKSKNDLAWDIGGFIIVVVILVAIRVCTARCFGGSGTEDSFDYIKHFMAGKRMMNQRNYDEAVGHFKICLKLAENGKQLQDVFNLLGKCYYFLGNYKEALISFDSSLEVDKKTNVIAYEGRADCYEKLNKFKEGYIDMLIVDQIRENKTYSDANKNIYAKLDRLIDKYTSHSADKHIKSNKLPFSNIKYEDFFSMFEDIVPKNTNEQDGISYFIQTKNYEKLYNTFNGPDVISYRDKFENATLPESLFTYKVVLFGIHYIAENYKECLTVLHTQKNDLEYILYEFLRTKNNKTYKPKAEFMAKADHLEKSNITIIQFWLAKFYKEQGNETKYLQIMNNIKEKGAFVFVDLLNHFKEKKNADKFKECEAEALKYYGNENTVIYSIFSYYHTMKNRNKCEEITKKLDMNSPRSLYMNALFYGMRSDFDSHRKLLKEALQLDSTYFDACFVLAKSYRLSEPVDYKLYLDRALQIASTYEDVRSVYKDTLLEESQKEFREKLPSIQTTRTIK